jgi:mannose/cellobiose epimerase-like protein (N-acyl-D-glucosamine 2-epimerase family)
MNRRLHALNERLIGWLVNDAYPRWALHGIDPQNGGFVEAIGQDGRALPLPRRARIHPRQVYAFAQAPALGWRGDVAGIVERGMEYFTAHYRRSDGLFRSLAGADGTVLDERATLYDQASALLGLAAAAALEDGSELERRAVALRGTIDRLLGAGDGSLRSEDAAHAIRESNPHMHLLEACVAWAEIGRDAGWRTWVNRLVELARSRFIREDSGALGECYMAAWQPAPGLAGRLIEPGHQFEWAWLLLRCESQYPNGTLRDTALRLLSIGEEHGVHRGVAINRLLDDMTIADANARFWPQTERLKAAALAATLTRDPRYWSMAQDAASSFFPYLDTPLPGLWFDQKTSDGAIQDTPAPASTLYHIVGAIAALNTALHS